MARFEIPKLTERFKIENELILSDFAIQYLLYCRRLQWEMFTADGHKYFVSIEGGLPLASSYIMSSKERIFAVKLQQEWAAFLRIRIIQAIHKHNTNQPLTDNTASTSHKYMYGRLMQAPCTGKYNEHPFQYQLAVVSLTLPT